MQYIVSLSGGVASAVAAERAIQRYGRDRVRLWYADTRAEDDDTYRFIDECMARWGGRLYRYCDGRTPLQVAEQHNIIPNQKIAPCTRELKIDPFVAMLWRQPKSLTVLLGLGWQEMRRIYERQRWHRKAGKPRPPTGYQRLIHGVYEDYPLLWKPLEFRPYQQVCRDDWAIAPPRAYELGFSHNNCLQHGCVKQGVKDWVRFRYAFPNRYAKMRDWEQAQRAKGGPRAEYAIMRDRAGGDTKPLTLAELEQRHGLTEFSDEPSQDDMFGCMCSY